MGRAKDRSSRRWVVARVAARAWQVVAGHDVFLSYSRSDGLLYARELRRLLANRDVFLDEQQLEPGSDLPGRVRRAARNCSAMVVLVSPGALGKSDWILREIQFADRSPLRPS